mmetsp:Transcript_6632/g.10016  ORF Transcript_6632/g.10016 Transcript_6632/m.10016 type:complete len:120 (+) Transcript_6632:136-495(+)
MKASRAMFSEISKKFPTLPFSLRSLEDERQAKLGVRELVQHELIAPYPVLYERADDHVVHVKFTVLLLPSGTTKITGMSLPEGMALSEGKTLPEDIQNLLAAENKKKKKSKKKKATGDA